MGGSSSTANFNYDAQLLNDAEPQSVEVEGGARRLKGYENGLLEYPEGADAKEWETLWSIMSSSAKRNPTNPCMGERKWTVAEDGKSYEKKRGDYVWETYEEIISKATNFGKGLVTLGAKKNDNIGIFASNSAHWVTACYGFYSQSIRVTSLYATLGNDAVEYIADHADLEFICVDTKNMPSLLKLVDKLGAEKGGKLKYIVLFDGQENWGNTLDKVNDVDVETAKAAGITLLGFSDVVKMGTESSAEIVAPEGNDTAFIMYTSGTTGAPKGAMLSHRNIAVIASSVGVACPMTSEEVHLSYLPLAHIFETAAQTACYSAGGRVGFSQGNPKLLTLDLLCIRPTMLCGVPRVFDKMYKKIFGGVADASFIKRWLFNSGYSTQCENVRKSAPRSEFYDNKIFKPLAEAKLGLDRCRLIITGAAPCPPYLMEFLKVCIDCIVVQGYGMTESSAGATFQLQTDPNTGHVGPPLPCNEVKLVDVPEMGYHSSDKPYPRGEVCVRGSNVFQGYYKAPDKTAETLVDGWLHTGDIGRWNPNGSLSIIDRKKNIFKLSQGEYVAAEKIELVYAKCALVGQVWIYGNSFKSFLLAVVAPNAEPFYNVAVEKGWMKSDLALGSDEFLAAFKAVFEGEHKDAAKKVIFEAMKLENKNLKGFEKVRDIVVEGELDATLAGFTEAKGTMTPTFKLRRPQLLRAYLKQLKEAYTANGEPPAADEVWPGEEE